MNSILRAVQSRRNATGSVRRCGDKPCGFTLIELLVVVGIISLISAILLPVLLRARDQARKQVAEQSLPFPNPLRGGVSPQSLPHGLAPIIDVLNLKMKLSPSYHRIGMDVFTRYQVDCAGSVTFRNPGGTDERRVVLTIPFPRDIVEARDVQLKIRRQNPEAIVPATDNPLLDVVYDRSGIYATCSLARGDILLGDLTFTAFGRDQFNYALPPSRELRSIAIELDLAGAEAHTIPDDSLQPSSEGPDQLKWEFKNLVSDRQITVLIPSAQAPLARVLLLSRLVAVAVLLFGAGFWFLSEQVKPGQLDSFRWGHFLLLALTYSLFFVIFAVLEFHGRLMTPVSMAVSALFSLPLLLLHVSRVLDSKFALTRVLPLAVLTLGLVINGVYGGALRDYIFIGATILIMAYVTVAYQSWAAGREDHLRNQEEAISARRRMLIEKITVEVGEQMATLDGAEALAKQYNQLDVREDLVMAQARLQSALKSVSTLRKEYEDLRKRLNFLPHKPGWDADESYNRVEHDVRAFQARLEPQLSHLQTELSHYRDEAKSLVIKAQTSTDGNDEHHCMACGRAVPVAPFCQNCGVAQPFATNCNECGEHMVIPLHIMAENPPLEALHCPRCGAYLPSVLAQESADGEPQNSDDLSL